LPIVGALFTERGYFSLDDIELGLAHEEQFDKLYPADYLKSLQLLEKLPAPTTDPQLKTMENAVEALNQGKSFEQICSVLAKLPIFKKLVPAGLPKIADFAVPIDKKKVSCDAPALGKRTPPRQ